MTTFIDTNGNPLEQGTRVRLPNWTKQAANGKKQSVPYEVGIGTVMQLELENGRDKIGFAIIQFDMHDNGATPGNTERFSGYCHPESVWQIEDIEVLSGC